MNIIQETIQYGDHQLSIKTGHIARQADAAVMVSLGDTQVLVTAVVNKRTDQARDFFPLTINYQEKAYAAGKIPGGFFKREGRPTEVETLTSRLIDRPIRPLFPEGYMQEIQVIATVVSLDPEINPDIPAMIGASAALSLSGVPFKGPIAGARVGYKDGIYTLNPSNKEVESSNLNLVVAGTKNAVLMVESEASELSEEVMLGAVLYGHDMMQPVIDMISKMVNAAQPTPLDWAKPEIDEQMAQTIEANYAADITAAYQVADKMQRNETLSGIQAKLEEAYADEEDEGRLKHAKELFSKLEKTIVRNRILDGSPRIDGRGFQDVRPISIETSVLPRAHGSALFTRGETQALVVATLGTDRDSQIIDALSGEYKDRYMLHYNFPAYSVGETGMMLGPKRREIGHGKLARRATEAVLPKNGEFPYVIRIVSEITESNGSSSMASVCGASLAMMDAGVPIKSPVSGIAMGLVKGENKYQVLTDILGDEDHLGDMDFKVAGSANGITALQMDIKIDGITGEIMKDALEQAAKARLHILDEMNKALNTPREQMSAHAPRIVTFKVPTDKIRDVIGKGGATIRSITEETGAVVEIEDDGTVKIYSSDEAAANDAQSRIEGITKGAEVGVIYDGTVKKIVDFGAFVAIMPGKEGLLHISQIKEERVDKVTDVLEEGQQIRVKVLDVDRQGRIKLSSKASELNVTEAS